jgi:predicted dehydrogenase
VSSKNGEVLMFGFGYRICLLATVAAFSGTSAVLADDSEVLRIGMIGLDTSHCLAFTKILNSPEDPKHIPGCRVVLVYPKGSVDIESSVSRVPEYTEKIEAMGVEVIYDLDAMVQQVDAVLLETNDGRPHLEQIVPVLKAGKPVFVDKPIAGSLADCIAIFELANHYKAPIFSSSSLRFGTSTQAVRGGSIGEVTGCDTFSPCSMEKTHPDLFWYGIHGVESLFTVMGAEVKTVVRTQTVDFEQVTGTWADGRIGTFRGIRSGKGGYGGMAFGTKATAAVGSYDGYAPLVVEIVKFFKSGQPPVTSEETTALYAFMEAADESKRRGFVPVEIAEVLQTARDEAAQKVAAIIAR